MIDFLYSDDGMFVALVPQNAKADVAWLQIAAETDGTGKVPSIHFKAVRAQLQKAGYTCRKAPKVSQKQLDAIMAELELL
jgi:hypothetical protein